MDSPDPVGHTSPVDPAVASLLEKYREMLRLRLADRDGTLADPRPAMRALAARFPGALREIDEIPLEALIARIDELDRAPGAAPWMRAHARYHELLRAKLAAKSERAPGGRLVAVVIAEIATEHGATPDDIRALVFPWSRKR